MTKVLFIGSNPSRVSRTNLPFAKNTRSWIVLEEWIKTVGLHPDDQLFGNVYPFKTENNRPLYRSEINRASEALKNAILYNKCTHIVALGKTATKALTQIGCKFLEMPHPSGLNRKLNDKKYVEEQLDKLKEYISAT